MNYEELSKIWNSANDKMADSLQINRELVKRMAVYKFKNGMLETKLSAWIEIAVSAFFFIFLVKFLSSHLSELRYALPAFILLALTVYGFVFEAFRLGLFYSVDASAPVVETQKKLARLRKLEIVDIKSLLIVIPLFSFPFLTVAAKSFLDIDLYSVSPGWPIVHIVGSLVVAAVLVFILLRFPDRDLRKTIKFLKELEE